MDQFKHDLLHLLASMIERFEEDLEKVKKMIDDEYLGKEEKKKEK